MMSTDKNIATWFKHEVFFWRLVYCTVVVVGIQLLVAVLSIHLLNLDLLHPIQGIIDGLRSTLSWSFAGYSFLLSWLTVGLVIVHAYRYKVVPIVHTSIGSTLWSLAQPTSLATIFCYSTIGGLFVRIYLGICGNSYSSLTVALPVDSAQHRLNEFHLFLVLHGVFVGFLYGLGTVISNRDCVYFPLIQRSKFTQIKSGLITKIREAARCQVQDFKWFILFYAVCGLSLQEWMTQMLHLHNGGSSVVALLCNLLSVKLWWTWFVTGATLCFVLDVISFVFTVFQTERIVFAIESPFEEDNYRTMKFALASSGFHLLQHLAFLDLNLAAQKSSSRLREIYSISQPGGHPHHWNAILKECLSLLKSFTTRLQEFTEPASPTPVEVKPATSPGMPTGQLYSLSVSNRSFERMRPLGSPGHSPSGANPYTRSPTSQAASQDLPPVLKTLPLLVSSLRTSFENRCHSMWKVFLNIPVIAYFLKESTETRIRKLFADCQCHIWAIEALSFIVSLSYTKDKYGVVQRDMPEIMRTLLDVQQAVNKIQKIDIHGTKRPAPSRLLSSALCFNQSLRCSIKLAIYRITSVFKYDLSCLDLQPSYEKKIESYVHFQE